MNQALRPKPEDGLPGLGLRFRPDGRQGLPRYSVSELNEAVGVLLQRGFAPRFLLDATVSKPVVRRGHLWMSLDDGDASIEAVAWASIRRQFDYEPGNGDGVNVIGTLNFWNARARLSVQILDIRPSLATVLRRFQEVHRRLEPEGLFELGRKRMLPFAPARLVILTSVPSSALADMLRTARERWPATRLTVVPISVQGRAEQQVVAALQAVSGQAGRRGFEALVLARGGGNRDDLALFDSESVARAIVGCRIPVVTGIGHEDDTTIADLVADYRAATPTAALVALLPERQLELRELGDLRQRMGLQLRQRLGLARGLLQQCRQQLAHQRPLQQLKRDRMELLQQQRLLRLALNRRLQRERLAVDAQRQLGEVLSPRQTLARGFVLLRREDGSLLRSASDCCPGESLVCEFVDGLAGLRVEAEGARICSEDGTSEGPERR